MDNANVFRYHSISKTTIYFGESFVHQMKLKYKVKFQSVSLWSSNTIKKIHSLKTEGQNQYTGYTEKKNAVGISETPKRPTRSLHVGGRNC